MAMETHGVLAEGTVACRDESLASLATTEKPPLSFHFSVTSGRTPDSSVVFHSPPSAALSPLGFASLLSKQGSAILVLPRGGTRSSPLPCRSPSSLVSTHLPFASNHPSLPFPLQSWPVRLSLPPCRPAGAPCPSSRHPLRRIGARLPPDKTSLTIVHPSLVKPGNHGRGISLSHDSITTTAAIQLPPLQPLDISLIPSLCISLTLTCSLLPPFLFSLSVTPIPVPLASSPQLLVSFLLLQASLASASFWWPYIRCLPRNYTLLCTFNEQQADMLQVKENEMK